MKRKQNIIGFDYVRFILPYFSIIITFSFIIFQPWDDKFMLIGLVLSLILLFLRQLYMWKDNQALIDTYEQLTTQLEDKVEEGASALSKVNNVINLYSKITRMLFSL